MRSAFKRPGGQTAGNHQAAGLEIDQGCNRR